MSLWCEGDGAECAECNVFDFLPSLCPECKRWFCWEHVLSHHLPRDESTVVDPPAAQETAMNTCSLSHTVDDTPEIREEGNPRELRPWCTLGRERRDQRSAVPHADQGLEICAKNANHSPTRVSEVSTLLSTSPAGTSSSPFLSSPSEKVVPTECDKTQGCRRATWFQNASSGGESPAKCGPWHHLPSSTLRHPLRLETDPSHHVSSTCVGIPVVLSASVEDIFIGNTRDTQTPSCMSMDKDHKRPLRKETEIGKSCSDSSRKGGEEDSLDVPPFEAAFSPSTHASPFFFSISSWEVATYFSVGRAIESCLEALWTDAEKLTGKMFFVTTATHSDRSEGENDHSDDSNREPHKGNSTCSCSLHIMEDRPTDTEEDKSSFDAKGTHVKVVKERESYHCNGSVDDEITSQKKKWELPLSPVIGEVTSQKAPQPSTGMVWPKLTLVPLSNTLLVQDVMRMKNIGKSSLPSSQYSFLLLHITTKQNDGLLSTVGEGVREQNGRRDCFSSRSSDVGEYRLCHELSQALFDSKWEQTTKRVPSANVKSLNSSATGNESSTTASLVEDPSHLVEEDPVAYLASVRRSFRSDPRVKAIRARVLLQEMNTSKKILKTTQTADSSDEVGASKQFSSFSALNSQPAHHKSSDINVLVDDTIVLPSLRTGSDSGDGKALSQTSAVHYSISSPGSAYGEVGHLHSPLPSSFPSFTSNTTTTLHWPFVLPPPLHSFPFYNSKVQPLRCEGLGPKDGAGGAKVRVAVFIEDAVLGTSTRILPVHVFIGASWSNGKAGQLVKETLLHYIQRECPSLTRNSDAVRLIQSKYELFAFLRSTKQKIPLKTGKNDQERGGEVGTNETTKFPCLTASHWRQQPLILQNGDCLFFGLPAECPREEGGHNVKVEEIVTEGRCRSPITNRITAIDTQTKTNHPCSPSIPLSLVKEVERMEQYTTCAEKQQLQKDLLTKCIIM